MVTFEESLGPGLVPHRVTSTLFETPLFFNAEKDEETCLAHKTFDCISSSSKSSSYMDNLRRIRGITSGGHHLHAIMLSCLLPGGL